MFLAAIVFIFDYLTTSWVIWGPSWAILGRIGGQPGVARAILNLSGAMLGRPWAILGRSWGHPAGNLGYLGLSGTHPRAILGRSWPALGPTRAILCHLGPMLRPSWGDLGPPRGHLGPSWAILAPSWRHCGQSWGRLGAFWGYLGAIWDQLGAILGCLGFRSSPLLLAELNTTVLAELRGDLALNFLRIMSGKCAREHGNYHWITPRESADFRSIELPSE